MTNYAVAAVWGVLLATQVSTERVSPIWHTNAFVGGADVGIDLARFQVVSRVDSNTLATIPELRGSVTNFVIKTEFVGYQTNFQTNMMPANPEPTINIPHRSQ